MALTLRDIGHASNALGLLEQARQELLMVGSDEVANLVDELEKLSEKIANATERAAGIKWSNE